MLKQYFASLFKLGVTDIGTLRVTVTSTSAYRSIWLHFSSHWISSLVVYWETIDQTRCLWGNYRSNSLFI